MKKKLKWYISLIFFLFALSFEAHAFRRYVEFGFDLGLGFANNFIGLTDIFQKNIVIDLNTLGDRTRGDGIALNTDLSANMFLNINPVETWGFGFSFGTSGGIFGNIPDSFLTLISEGNINIRSPSGDFTVYGGVFADAKINVHAQIKRLRVSIAPAVYVPIFYIPKSSINYRLSIEEDVMEFSTEGELNVYSFFSLGDFDNISMEEDAIVGAYGFDLSLNVEYRLFSFLDIGADITNIPLYPATLNHRMYVSMPFEFKLGGDSLSSDGSEGVAFPDLEFEREYTSGVSKKVYRPLRFNFYTNLKPLNFMNIKPNVGFTVLTPSGDPYFNAGLTLQLYTKRFFFFQIGTAYEENMWKHRAGLALDFRVCELRLEAGLMSQELASSFMLRGFSFSAGMSFGF